MTAVICLTDAIAAETLLAKQRIISERIRAERIAGDAPKTVYRNVSPPPGTPGLGYSGVDPKDIKDPAARKEYEATIRRNRLNVGRQGRLADMERIPAGPIVDYLIRIASNDPSSRPLVRQAIVDARLTEAPSTGLCFEFVNQSCVCVRSPFLPTLFTEDPLE